MIGRSSAPSAWYLSLVARSDGRGVETARRECDPVDFVRVIANVANQQSDAFQKQQCGV